MTKIFEAGDRVLLLGQHRGYIMKARIDDNGVPLYDVSLDRGSGYADDYAVARDFELKAIDAIRERMEKCRKFGDETNNGVAYDWWLAGPGGAGYLLFREPHHTDEDIEKAKSQIRRDHDVADGIRVERVKPEVKS